MSRAVSRITNQFATRARSVWAPSKSVSFQLFSSLNKKGKFQHFITIMTRNKFLINYLAKLNFWNGCWWMSWEMFSFPIRTRASETVFSFIHLWISLLKVFIEKFHFSLSMNSNENVLMLSIKNIHQNSSEGKKLFSS